MNDPKSEPNLEIITDPDTPIVVTRRSVKAPRSLVYDAFTKPELVRRWKTPAGLEWVDAELDLRAGGAWRVLYRTADGQEFGFHGLYLEVDPPARFVRTFVFGDGPEQELEETVELQEEGARTRIVTTTRYKSMAVRETLSRGRMDPELHYVRLDELLAELLGAAASA
ncbi:MAG: SRPBCC domain-containing protein [Nannocystaceae bacterium]